ncbi:MAG: 5'-3' exonuclease H3TH domain-containing protein, partial [Pirellulales bacterium]
MKSKKSIVAPNLQNKTVLAIDTLSRVYQLFHALPEMSSPKGVPVSVVYGLTRDLLDIINKKKPSYLLFAMDAAGPTFRHEQFEDYKANRAEMPADLVTQIPLIRQLFEVMGIPCLELAGYEADDVLATLATQTVALGGECIIATADKDARQLIGENVRLLNLRNNAIIGKQELVEDWGLRPDQVVDYLSLVGDAVDNVPGVPGIGPKTASELLKKYESLENLFAHLDEVSGKKRKENLATHEETAKAGQDLIRLETAVPIDIPWDDAQLHQPDTKRLISFLQDMGFKSLVQKVAGSKSTRGTKKKNQSGGSDRNKQALFDLDQGPASPSAASVTQDTMIGINSVIDELQTDKEIRAFVDTVNRESTLATCFVVAETQRFSSPPSGVVLASEESRVYVSREVLEKNSLLKNLLSDQQYQKIVYDLKRQSVAAGLLGLELQGVIFDALIASYLLEAGERTMGPADIARRNSITINASPEGLPFEPESLHCTTERAAAATVCQIVQFVYAPL